MPLSLPFRTLACLALASLTSQAWPLGSPYSSQLDWSTRDSEHFRIHYPAPAAPWVERVAAIAEQAHRRLSPKLGWQPADKTDVVLADPMDLSNGAATPLPGNRMYLYLRAPEADSALAQPSTEHWLELLITHEYTHILHLDRANGLPSWIRPLLGRNPLSFPNALMPRLWSEGMAVLQESETYPQHGRLDSPHYAMLMRMELTDNGVKPYRQVFFDLKTPPGGVTPYLYGVHLLQFLAERYGRDKVDLLLANVSEQILPWQLEAALRRSIGRDLDQLWPEFGDWLSARYLPALQQRRSAGIVAGDALGYSGDAENSSGRSVKALADGSVYYLYNDHRSNPEIRRRLGNGSEQRIAPAKSRSRFDVAGNAIALLQLDTCQGSQLSYNLYWLNANGGEAQRLTDCARIQQLALQTPQADGSQQIATVEGEYGQQALRLRQSDGLLLRELLRNTPDELLHEIDFAPDGQSLLLLSSRQDGRWRLQQLRLDGERKLLWQGAEAVSGVSWRGDGQAILLTVHDRRAGQLDLWRLDPASGALQQISRVEGGAFQPHQASAGSPLYYLGYRAAGYDLYRIVEPRPLTASSPTSAPPLLPEPLAPAATVELDAARPYRALPSLRPTSWWPLLMTESGNSQYGALISGSDALEQHEYSAQLLRDVSNQSWTGAVRYLYDERWLLAANRQHSTSLRGDDSQLLRSRRTDRLQLHTQQRLFDQQPSHWLAAAGLDRETTSDLRLGQGVAPRRDEHSQLLGVALKYQHSERYRDGAGPVGRRSALFAERHQADDWRGAALRLDWREYLPLPAGQQLGLRAHLAWANAAAKPFEHGGSFEPESDGLNQRSFALRGYARQPALVGNAFQHYAAEWRAPLGRVERGFITLPVAVGDLSSRWFAETIQIDGQGPHAGRWHGSAGVELVGDVQLGYFLPLQLRLGWAYGFTEAIGGSRAYLSLGSSF